MPDPDPWPSAPDTQGRQPRPDLTRPTGPRQVRGAVRRAVQVSGRAEPGRAPLVSIWEARELAEDAKGVGRSDVVEELRIDVLDDGDGARTKPRAPRRVTALPQLR